jgi:hypothetical protein
MTAQSQSQQSAGGQYSVEGRFGNGGEVHFAVRLECEVPKIGIAPLRCRSQALPRALHKHWRVPAVPLSVLFKVLDAFDTPPLVEPSEVKLAFWVLPKLITFCPAVLVFSSPCAW